MVSNASDDLPDPETPVTTVNWLCGISKSMFFRLWTRAPRTTMLSFDMAPRIPAGPQNRPKWDAETFDYNCWSLMLQAGGLSAKVKQSEDVDPEHAHEMPIPRSYV